MFFELAIATGIGIIIMSLIAEFIDSTLGMGYGTSLTPILMMFGFLPLEIVPAILLSEFVTGITAGIAHHSFGNVDFGLSSKSIKEITRWIKKEGIVKAFHKVVPTSLKVVLLFSVISIFWTIFAVMLAVTIPMFYVKLYIGILVLIIGFVILFTRNHTFRFSWLKLGVLGAIAAFNKGISGGGYGPLVASGQMISGVRIKSAIAITALAEGIVCLVGVITYYFTTQGISWKLAPYLLIGSVISVPLSAFVVKKVNTKKLKLIVGIVTMLLGAISIAKLF